MKVYIKTDKKIINFGIIEVEKHKFHQDNNHILINNVSNKVYFGKKYFGFFIGYKDAKILDLYA